MIIQLNSMEYEIQKIIQTSNKCYYAFCNLFKARVLSKKLKVQLYITPIRSIVLYGAQRWIVRESEELRLRIWKEKY